MSIVLVNLPWEVNGRKGVRAGSRWPFTSMYKNNGSLTYIPFPFFLAYATSLLKKTGHKAQLIDAIAEGIDTEAAIQRIVSCAPKLLVIETSTPSFENDIEITRELRKRDPYCRIALCGPHVSVFSRQILEEYDFIDYVFVGEYEHTLLDLASRLKNALKEEPVLGLAYRKNSLVVVNRPRPCIKDLDDLPWPERKSLPMYKYNDNFCDLPKPNVQMWSSRGCPFRCTFCLWPQTMYMGARYRKRSVVDVVDEMEYLIKDLNFKAVYFDDDIFNADKNHVRGICAEMTKRGIDIPWAAMARADLMDKKTLEAMAQSGLYAIKYGIESANSRVLSSVKKNMDLSKTKRAIKDTKALGVKVHLTFCVGLPGETRDTIKKSIDLIGGLEPDSLQFSFATPFPGTEYFRSSEARGDLLSRDWSDYDGNNKCIIKTDSLTNRELKDIRKQLLSNFPSAQ